MHVYICTHVYICMSVCVYTHTHTHQVGAKQAVSAMNHIKRLQWQGLKDAALHERMKVCVLRVCVCTHARRTCTYMQNMMRLLALCAEQGMDIYSHIHAHILCICTLQFMYSRKTHMYIHAEYDATTSPLC